MVSVPDTADVVAKRRDVLRALTEPLSKPALVEELGRSRSTVDRAIDALLDERLVEQRGSRYVATFAGREAVTAYDRFLDRVDALSAAQPVLGELPPDVAVDPAVLEGAEVVESTMAAPTAPIEANAARVDGATAFHGTGPAVIPQYIEEVTGLVAGGTETELVLTEAVVEAASTAYAEEFAGLTDAENLDLFVTDSTMPYAVWVAEKPGETVAGIVVYSDDGIVGVVNNDSDAMVEWARESYETFKRDAEPLG
ncbi:helix-turn-helix transcriptional regulator [Haloarcula litorea]|uniref:helix-turn-helix transcriptional regulator n=1 Tax=Haloarcula litorea TaxID=3032579 RepID=UPI0023E79D32|nr:hypothetical protein [Halomicroarcula sp. GDY20]